MTDHVTLRAETNEDSDFLFRVFASTRDEEMNMVPWSPEQKNAFLRMQFQAQTSHYRQHFADAAFLIILYGNHAAGRICVSRTESEIHVVDIALLPEFRNAGIATGLLKDLLVEAEASGKQVTMYVLRNNQALRLYQRLGFRLKEDNGSVYLLLDWQPAVSSAEPVTIAQAHAHG